MLVSVRIIDRGIVVFVALGTLLLGPRCLGAQTDPFQPGIPAAEVKALGQARTDRMNKDLDKAIAELRNLLAARPDYYLARYNLGLAYAATGQNTAAVQELTAALKIKESQGLKDGTIYNSLGWLYLTDGDYKNAGQYLKQAAANEGMNSPATNERVFNNLGLLYLYEGKYAESEGLLKKAAGLGSSGALNSLALLHSAKASRRKDLAGHVPTSAGQCP